MTTITKVAGAVAAGTAIVIKAADGIKAVAVAIHTVALALAVKAHVVAVSAAEKKIDAAIDAEKAVLAANIRREVAANAAVELAVQASIKQDDELAKAQTELARYAA